MRSWLSVIKRKKVYHPKHVYYSTKTTEANMTIDSDVDHLSLSLSHDLRNPGSWDPGSIKFEIWKWFLDKIWIKDPFKKIFFWGHVHKGAFCVHLIIFKMFYSK